MADEPNNPNTPGPGGRPINLNTVNVKQANVGRVAIQRYRANATDANDANTDLLEEISKLMGEFPEAAKTLKSILDEIKKLKPSSTNQKSSDNLVKSTDAFANAMVAAAETAETVVEAHQTLSDETSRTVGTLNAFKDEISATQKELDKFRASTKSGDHTLTGFMNVMKVSGSAWTLFQNGLRAQLKANFTTFLESFNTAGRRVMTFSNIVDPLKDQFNTAVTLAGTRMASWTNVLSDTIVPFVNGMDDLKTTAEEVNKAIQAGMINPIHTLGNTIGEVATNLSNLRGGAFTSGQIGFDFYQAGLSSREANEAIISLYDLQRRSNRSADINDIGVRNTMVEQLRYLEFISQNTGISAKAILDNAAKDQREIADLVGFTIDKTQAQGYQALVTALDNQGLGALSELVKKVARTGGNQGFFARQNEQLYRDLQTSGNSLLPTQIASIANNANLSMEQRIVQLQRLMANTNLPQFNAGNVGYGVLFRNPEFQSIVSEMRKITEFTTPTNTSGPMALLSEIWGRVQDALTNIFPANFRSLSVAILANVAALEMNTIALGGTGLARLAGGLIGGAGRLLGFGGLRAAAGAAGEVAGAGAAGLGGLLSGGAGLLGSVAGFGARTLLKGLPLVGLGLGAYDAYKHIQKGQYWRAAIDAAGGLASFIPGVGSLVSIGTGIGMNAYDMYNPGTPQVIAPQPRRTSDISNPDRVSNDIQRNDAADNLDRRTSLLVDIRDLLTTANRINSETAKNTSRVASPTGTSTVRKKNLPWYESILAW